MQPLNRGFGSREAKAIPFCRPSCPPSLVFLKPSSDLFLSPSLPSHFVFFDTLLPQAISLVLHGPFEHFVSRLLIPVFCPVPPPPTTRFEDDIIMRSVSVLSTLVAATAVQAGPAKRQSTLPPITVKGNAFFKGTERFYIRGLDYQPGGSSGNIDPLADEKVCMPDIEKFKTLGINTIRVYSTDNSKDHSTCMNALAAEGIYVVLDANNPLYSINRAKPAPSYNKDYLQSIFATIDEFGKYPNTMAFFSGNEVIHDEKETTLTAPYVKAVTRDMRQYIRTRFDRPILVGYSAADVTDNRMQTAAYFNCGTDDERSDFFAFVCWPTLACSRRCDANPSS